MKQISKDPRRPPFIKWKEYQRFPEELVESKDQVKQFRQQNSDCKNFIQHILENCNHELKEASKALDMSKNFVKWSHLVRRQCINSYIRNSVLNAQLRSMRQDLQEAHKLLKIYEGATVINLLMKMPKFDPKFMNKAIPALELLVEKHDLANPDSKTKTPRAKASSSKISSKRKRK